MPRRLVLAALLMALALPVAAGARAFDDTAKLKPNGLGPLKTGMTADEVAHVLGRGVRVRYFPESECGTARLDGRNYMLFTGDHLRRVTLASGQYATTRGVRVGDPQDAIRDAYGADARRSPNVYVPDGYYFTVSYGRLKRIRFETDGSAVTSIHAGRTPEVDYVEGCA